MSFVLVLRLMGKFPAGEQEAEENNNPPLTQVILLLKYYTNSFSVDNSSAL